MRALSRYLLLSLLSCLPVKGVCTQDVVVVAEESGATVQRRGSLLRDRVVKDSIQAICVSQDTIPFGSGVAKDSLAISQDTLSSGIHLPRLSEFRDIHRNDTLTSFQKVKRYGNFFVRVIDAFDNVDECYVERNAYNFTAMLQTTTNMERYSIGTPDYVESMVFAQHPDCRIGPYLGWKWLFLGYTFDVTNIGRNKSTGTRFELSIYTSMIGIDLIWRRTGNDFHIKRIDGLGDAAKAYEGQNFRYIEAGLTGVNIYYNFNHRRYSSPAVFSQSSIQRRSAGSWQLGACIMSNDVKFDYSALPTDMFAETERKDQYASLERLRYWDYSVIFGYGYNWVPARNWCVGISVLPSLGYKHATSQTVILEEKENAAEDEELSFFKRMNEVLVKRGNVNVGGTARLGLIYNNGRWFAGLFGVVHHYRYRRNDLRFLNTFGTVNLCVGFYFQKKKSAQKGSDANVVKGAD